MSYELCFDQNYNPCGIRFRPYTYILTFSIFLSRYVHNIMNDKYDTKVTRANAFTRTSFFQGRGKANFLLMKLYINRP